MRTTILLAITFIIAFILIFVLIFIIVARCAVQKANVK